MAPAWRWTVRLFALVAMVVFAALAVIFVVVTIDQFGAKNYVTDNVSGLPPVYVLTAILVPFCLLFVAGFWMLFMDSFKPEPPELVDAPDPVPGTLPDLVPLRERFAQWRQEHRPQWPGRAG
jgi:TRAP-type C4-dicarboxylate transport system permease small subunit